MKNIVNLYIFNIDNLNESFDEIPFLSAEDIKKAKRYKDIKDQKLHIISSYLKNKYVGEYKIDDNQKPISDNVYFNISHSDNLVILGICKNREIGVDIETITIKNDDLIDYVCNEEERKYVTDETKFMEVWTSKESLVKCKGTGIDTKPKNINSLPINGYKTYDNQDYFTKTFLLSDYAISITLKGKDDFEITKEEIKEV